VENFGELIGGVGTKLELVDRKGNSYSKIVSLERIVKLLH
jgi:hypothetical protein